MSGLYLIIVGIMLMVSNVFALGLIAFIVGLVCVRRNEPLWAIVLGIILLLAVPGWAVAGIVGIVLGLLERRS
jgi:hypothetical protein